MEMNTFNGSPAIPSSIAPWLSVPDGVKAITFYMSAFSATETYRMETPGGGMVLKLSVNGAEFWVSVEADQGLVPLLSVPQPPVRMILTVTDPDAIFFQALQAGATQVYPVSDGYGWRIGRIVDPFGHHWEIGRPLTD